MGDKAAMKAGRMYSRSGRIVGGMQQLGSWAGILASTVFLALMLYGPAGFPDEQGETPFFDIDIPSLNAADALNRLAEQTGATLLFPYDLASARQANAVTGRYSLRDALERLLQGSGLSGDLSNNGVIRISVDGDNRRSDKGKAMMASKDGRQDRNSGRNSLIAGIAAFLASTFTTPAAVGQERSAAQSPRVQMLEEIVVTAQKREQNLFDVPMSIVALTDVELEKRKIKGWEDLGLAVPGLSIQDGGPGSQRRIFIRGVSTAGGFSQPVGIYVDEAPISGGHSAFSIDTRLYDLERVEVLRGPQGTLYGEGSLGGTIRFITKSPQLDHFTAKADVDVSFTKDGEPGQRIQGVINIPLLKDEIGLRIAGTFDNAGGWIDQPQASVKNINEQNLTSVRIRSLWKPTEALSVEGMATIYRNNGSVNTGDDDNGHYVQAFGLTTIPSSEDDYELYNLNLTYDFDTVRLHSSSSYLNAERRDSQLKEVFGTFHLFFDDSTTRNEMFTQELRLSSNTDGSWQWTVGGYYKDLEYASEVFALFGFFPPGPPIPFPFDLAEFAESWAVFGDTSYALTEQLEIGVGLRHFEDERRNASGGVSQAQNFDNLTPRFYANYDVTEDIKVYGSASKGFRSGGFNASPTSPAFGPEELWTYELGTKMLLLGNRFETDVALFYSEYSEYIVAGVPDPLPATPPLFIESNAGDATIKGIDWDLTWHVTDALALGFNGNYVDTEFDEIRATGTGFAVGERLPWIPKYQFTGSANYDFILGKRPGYARLDYNQVGRMISPLVSKTPSDVINMLNLHVGWEWSNNLSFGVFAQNLLNERGFLDPLFELERGARPRPRTFGFEFGVEFE